VINKLKSAVSGKRAIATLLTVVAFAAMAGVEYLSADYATRGVVTDVLRERDTTARAQYCERSYEAGPEREQCLADEAPSAPADPRYGNVNGAAYGGIRAAYGGIRAAYGGPGAPQSGTYSPEEIPLLGPGAYAKIGAVAVQGDVAFAATESTAIDLTFRPNANVKWAHLHLQVVRYALTAGVNTSVIEGNVPFTCSFVGSGDTNQITGATPSTPGAVFPDGREPLLVGSFSKENPLTVNCSLLAPTLATVPADQEVVVLASLMPIAERGPLDVLGALKK